MKTIKIIFYFVIGVLLINHGYSVIDTGILLNASVRGNVIISAGEYSNIIGVLLACIGVSICVFTVISAKAGKS